MTALFAALFTWDIDPILIDFGPLQIRYYGLWFAATIYAGLYIWQREARERGFSPMWSERFLLYAVLGIVLGSRLGHCLFYEPERYLPDLWTWVTFDKPFVVKGSGIKAYLIACMDWMPDILKFWKGGLASHGATLGLIFVLWLFGRRYKTGFLKVTDMVVPAIAFAAGGVRIGNFFNSEIVGRFWDGPWAVIFARYDRMMGIDPAIPRHPTALYEVLMGLITYMVLIYLKKRDVRRAGSGFLFGVFMICYFSFRFIVEFFKEFQVDKLMDKAREVSEAGQGMQLTMGQFLSIAPVLVGVIFVIRALRQDREQFPVPVAWVPGQDGEDGDETSASSAGGKGKKKRRKK